MERFESMLGILNRRLNAYLDTKDEVIVYHIQSIVKDHGILLNEISSFMENGRLEIIAVNGNEHTVGIEVLLDHNVIGKFTVVEDLEYYPGEYVSYGFKIRDYPFYNSGGPDHFGYSKEHVVSLDFERFKFFIKKLEEEKGEK